MSTPANEKTVRDGRIDAMRWAAMVFVLLGHALLTAQSEVTWAPEAVRAIESFNMPLFAFLSGLTMKSVRIGRRCTQLMVPYFLWLGLYYLFLPSPSSSLLYHLADGALRPLGPAKPWFPYVLFICLGLFWLFQSISPKHHRVILISVAGGMLLLSPGITVLGIGRVFWLFPYLVVGWLFGREQLLDKLPAHAGRWMVPGGIAIWASGVYAHLLFGNGWMRVLQNERSVADVVVALPIRLISQGVQFATAIAAVLVFVGAYLPRRGYGISAILGRHTLGMFFIQTLIWHWPPLRSSGNVLLVFVVTVVVAAAGSVFLSRTPVLRVLVGRSLPFRRTQAALLPDAG